MKLPFRDLAAIVEVLTRWQNTEMLEWPLFRPGSTEYKSTTITQRKVFGLTTVDVLVAEKMFS